MPSPLTVTRNNYRKNRKPTDTETLHPLAQFVPDTVVKLEYMLPGIVFDIGYSKGNLSRPFVEDGRFAVVGIDTIDSKDGGKIAKFIQMDFLTEPSRTVFRGRILSMCHNYLIEGVTYK